MLALPFNTNVSCECEGEALDKTKVQGVKARNCSERITATVLGVRRHDTSVGLMRPRQASSHTRTIHLSHK